MGYYTSFSLKVRHKHFELTGVQQREIIKKAREKNEELKCAVLEDGSSALSSKWYEWVNEMEELSQHFSDIIFSLSGDGEENDDIWEAHFCNGESRVCKAEIMIPPLDLSWFNE